MAYKHACLMNDIVCHAPREPTPISTKSKSQERIKHYYYPSFPS